MTRYYISITDPFTPENALASYSSEAAALRAKGVLKLEIYTGFYDEEWGLQSKEDRLEKADAVEVYEVKFSPNGAIRSKKKLSCLF